MRSRMLNYRIEGNLRIECAKEFLKAHLDENEHILEIGCGIGILSEHMATVCKTGKILSLDLSKKNIWYAKKTVAHPKIEFRQMDILTHEAKKILKTHVVQNGTFTSVVLIDVIEHIPPAEYETLFSLLKELLCDEFKILITYPSPAYQRYLYKELPSELQPIDEIIDFGVLEKFCTLIYGEIKYYALKDVWMRGQYMHVIISNNSNLKRTHNKIQKTWKDKLLKKYRYNKYAVKPFADI